MGSHRVMLGLCELATGNLDYCRGFADAYNLNGHAGGAEVVGAGPCTCGPLRKEVVREGDERFLQRTGCAHCNTWDGPVRLRQEPLQK